MRRRAVPTMWYLIALYGLGIALFLVVRYAAEDNLPAISLVDTFLHLLVLPALLLLPLSLATKHWQESLLLTPAFLFFIVFYGPRFLPRSLVLASDMPSFKVMTYNLHAEDEFLDGMVNLIREADADVVALQELSYPAAARFTEEFKTIYPYQMLHPKRYGNAGQGVLSRFPLWGNEYWQNMKSRESLGHQKVKVLINGVAVTLFNTHPFRPVLRGINFDDQTRRKEIAEVLKRADKESGPVLIIGDFNMTDQTGDYFKITKAFKDAYREVGWGLGPTFPNSNPATAPSHWLRRVIPVPLFLRLDYLFYSNQIKALEARVWPTSGGSDHHPVIARLALMVQVRSEELWQQLVTM